MSAGLFITGTDTGVGKTTVACVLASALRAEGTDVGVMKPIETGCPIREGRLYSRDGARLQRSAGTHHPLDLVSPYRYGAPVAPLVASAAEHRPVSLFKILRRFQSLSKDHRLMLIEGVGGLLVPLTSRKTVADLAQLFGLPVIIVASNRLGVLNHTLLTVEAAITRGLSVAGVILNNVTKGGDRSRKSNADTLAKLLRHWQIPLWGVVDFLPHAGAKGQDLEGVRRSLRWQEIKDRLGL